VQHAGAHDGARQRHEQCGGHSFIGDIADGDTQLRLLAIDKVIEVATHLKGRLPIGGKFPARNMRRVVRDETGLYLARDLQLALYTSLLDGDLVEARVLDGDGRAGGDGREQVQVGLGKAARFVRNLDHADHVVL